MASDLVQLDHVSLTYFTGEAATTAIADLTFSVKQGEFVAIVGPSGCGKTSVLSILMGLIPPTFGTVRFSKEDCRIGYMLQRDHLLEWRTVEKNVLLGLEVQHRLTESSKARAMEILSTYGLTPFLHHKPHQLSGGMRQKVALIRTLAPDPELLLLDEPFSALDYQTRLHIGDEVHAIIKQEKRTAILVTHDIGEAVSLADRVLVFSERPCTVWSIVPIDIREYSPLQRRKQPAFQAYFEEIWEEMNA